MHTPAPSPVIGFMHWWLDIVEYENGVNPSNAFSVGPILMEFDRTYTLGQFQQKVNTALQDAIRPPGVLTTHEYVFKIANIEAPEQFFSGDALLSDDPVDLAIIYHIYPADLVGPLGPVKSGMLDSDDEFKFKVNFYSGPHGVNEISRPPSLNAAEIGETFDEVLPLTAVNYEVRPQSRLLLTPGFSANALMLSPPPVRPNVEIIPIIGSSRRFKIFFDGMVGDYNEPAISLGPADRVAMAQQYLAQGVPLGNVAPTTEAVAAALGDSEVALGPINFRSGAPVTAFEILRTTTKPTNYAAFSGTGRTFIPIISAGKVATNGIHIESIRANTVYYYCFRAINIHGNVSNPTHVYRVELVDNDGQRFLTQKIIYFPNPNEQYLQPKKTGRKLIYIEPSEPNLLFNTETYLETTGPAEISIGAQPASNILGRQTSSWNCWDRVFKIRVTSKKTGKKFDINVTLKNSGVLNP